MSNVEARSGWATFAGVIAFIVGGYNLVSGIAAVAEDDRVSEIREVLFGIDITAWGWFWIVIGIAQLITSVLIFMRHSSGQMLGILMAGISAFFTVFLIFVAPLWALTVIFIDLLLIYALIANPDEFE